MFSCFEVLPLPLMCLYKSSTMVLGNPRFLKDVVEAFYSFFLWTVVYKEYDLNYD